jgi:hypothetical protein
MSEENLSPEEYQLWAMGFSKEDREKLILLATAYGLDPTRLGILVRTSNKKEVMSYAIDVHAQRTFMIAKQILAQAGYANISRELYLSMRKRIEDLEGYQIKFYGVSKDAVELLTAIRNDLDGFENEIELAEHADNITKLIERLEVFHKQGLPLIAD